MGYIEANDKVFRKQLLNLYNGLNRLSVECKSQVISALIKTCSDNIEEYTKKIDTFVCLYDQFEADHKSECSALDVDMDLHYKKFESIKKDNSQSIIPELVLENMENELSYIRDAIRKKDRLIESNDSVIIMVQKAHDLNSEIRNEIVKLAIISFSPMLSDEASKFIINEIAKELDFTFILKAKSLAERFKKESEKIVVEIIEADNSFLKWEEFRDNLCDLNSKITLINSEIQQFVKQ